jgi:hypothetical protein
MRILSALILTTGLGLLPLGSAALADTAPQPVISVTGTGTVEVVPDLATLSIGVTSQGDTAAAALDANSALVAAVLERLAAEGIAARDIQTSGLSVNPNWTGYDSSSSGPTISGYVAMNVVTVRVRDLGALGTILDAAITDGANTLNGVTFGLADPAPATDAARTAAVADARARAEQLAAAAGVSLGPVLVISEGGTGEGPAPMFREASMSPVPVMGGEMGVSAQVFMTFAIAD